MNSNRVGIYKSLLSKREKLREAQKQLEKEEEVVLDEMDDVWADASISEREEMSKASSHMVGGWLDK